MDEKDRAPDLGAMLPVLLSMLGDAGSEPESGECAPTPPLDPALIGTLLSAVGSFTSETDEIRLLQALRPLLSPERQPKVDTAIRLVRLAGLFPLLRDSGLWSRLF